MKLEMKQLICGYRHDRPLTEPLSFSVQGREVCCILGRNGVGKTTLFKTILQLIPPLSGRITLDGEDFLKFGRQRISKQIAYVPQVHVPPFPYKVEDVVLLGRVISTGYFKQPGAMDYEIAEEAMREMDILHLRDRSYTEVSGGERQLVLLARALAQEPKILMLDEPTTGLDYRNQVRVLERICRLRDQGYAVIMTTHDPDHAFRCEGTALLLQKDAQAVFGPAREVLTERSLKEGYGVDVRIVEYYSENGTLQKVCSPQMTVDHWRRVRSDAGNTGSVREDEMGQY